MEAKDILDVVTEGKVTRPATELEIAIFHAGKRAVIKEVVDYFFYEAGIVRLMGCATMQECLSKLPNWQAKLKEWGIEGGKK